MLQLRLQSALHLHSQLVLVPLSVFGAAFQIGGLCITTVPAAFGGCSWALQVPCARQAADCVRLTCETRAKKLGEGGSILGRQEGFGAMTSASCVFSEGSLEPCTEQGRMCLLQVLSKPSGPAELVGSALAEPVGSMPLACTYTLTISLIKPTICSIMPVPVNRQADTDSA